MYVVLCHLLFLVRRTRIVRPIVRALLRAIARAGRLHANVGLVTPFLLEFANVC